MKRLYSLLAVTALILFLVTGCGSDGDKEAKSIMKKQADVTDNFAQSLTDAKSADDVVNALDRYTESMKEMVPELIAFEKKYPDYEKEGKAPEGMEEEVKRVEETSAKVASAMMKIGPYIMEKKVQEALERMGTELQALDETP